MPLSFKDDIGNAALGTTALGNAALRNAALGTTALGTVALGSIVLRKSLINQPLAQCLLDHLLRRSFSFVSQSLVRSFSGEKVIEYYPTLAPYCPPNLISLVLICIQTAAGTVLPPIPIRTWADTPTAPNPNQLPALYCHLNRQALR